MKPFIKKLKTKNNYYIYDVNSNHFLKVDKVVYEIIEDIYKYSKECILNKWIGKFNKHELTNAVNSLHKSIEKECLFLATRPKGIKFSLSKSEIKEKLDHFLDQLSLEVTEQCNMRCSYCVYSGIFPYKRKHSESCMSFDTAKQAIDFYLSHSKKNVRAAVTFYGGEPLIAFPLIKECVEYIDEKASRKMRFGITTNGTLLNDEIIKFLIGKKFSMTLSLDGPKEIHDRYRIYSNRKGTYDIIMSNLRKIRKISQDYYFNNINFNIVISPPFHLGEIKDFFDSLDIVKHNYALNSFFVKKDETKLFQKKMHINKKDLFYQLRIMRNIFKINLITGEHNKSPFCRSLFEKQIGSIYKRGIFKQLEDFHPPNGICIPGLRKIFVNTNGNFYICESMDDFQTIGNIYHGLDYKKVYSLIEDYCNICHLDCINCWAVRLCNLCFVASKEGKRLDLLKKRKSCERFKINLEENMIFYLEVLEKNPQALEYLKNMIYS